MAEQKDIILQLKAVKDEKKFSIQNIHDMMERNGDHLSKTTISRVFKDGSENDNFRYNDTIRPIAKALLDIETIEDDDTADIRTMKMILKYKAEKIATLEEQHGKAALQYKEQISRLENQLASEKQKYHEKLEKERKQFNDRIDFLMHQIDLKDKRMDQKDQRFDKLFDQFLNRCENCHMNKKK
jgi:hypothetical protein